MLTEQIHLCRRYKEAEYEANTVDNETSKRWEEQIEDWTLIESVRAQCLADFFHLTIHIVAHIAYFIHSLLQIHQQLRPFNFISLPTRVIKIKLFLWLKRCYSFELKKKAFLDELSVFYEGKH